MLSNNIHNSFLKFSCIKDNHSMYYKVHKINGHIYICGFMSVMLNNIEDFFSRFSNIHITKWIQQNIIFFPDVAVSYTSELATVEYLLNLVCHFVLVRFVLDRYSITSCQIATSQYLICKNCVTNVKNIALFHF